MADIKDTSESGAEEAYAAAAAETKDKQAPAPKAPAPKAPVKKTAAKTTVARKAPARKIAAKKAVAKPTPAPKPAPKPKAKPAAKPVAKKPAPVAAKAAPAAPQTKTPTVTELKEKIMATKTVDFTEAFSKPMTDAIAEMQSKAQAAYDKGTAMVADMTELAKGNVEAFVESGKILAGGVQDMGKTYADGAKSAYETATADMKEMAAVKSPTELFQLQGKILRRNFDAMVASSSKSTEAAMKLANDVIAPISGRVNLTVEKLSAVA